MLHDRVRLVCHLAAPPLWAPGKSCPRGGLHVRLAAGGLHACQGFDLFFDGLQAAPVAAHAFCNVLGFPDFGSIAAHPRPRAVALAFAAGIAAFAAGLLPLTRPAMFSNASSDGNNAYIDACRQLVKVGTYNIM